MLSSKQMMFLKGKAHPLKPIVQMGQKGLTDGVVAEADRALTDHELIKVRLGDLAGSDQSEKDARQAAADQIAKGTRAEVVALVGKIVILYRRHPENPTLKLP